VSIDVLTILLTHARGPIGRPPRMTLSLSLTGMRGQEAAGSVAADGAPFRDFTVAPAAFDALRRAAERAGLETRPPRVTGVNDTSDGFAWVHLYASHSRGAHTLDLSLLSSGYEGEDADALRAFLRLLLDAAGVRDDGARFDLAGP
jgi:hypothetical protein